MSIFRIRHFLTGFPGVVCSTVSKGCTNSKQREGKFTACSELKMEILPLSETRTGVQLGIEPN